MYRDHPCADRAKRNLSKPSFHIGKSILLNHSTTFFHFSFCIKLPSKKKKKRIDNSDTITVNWADPVPEPDDDTMREVKTLYPRAETHTYLHLKVSIISFSKCSLIKLRYIRSLPEGVTEAALQDFFSRFGEVKEVNTAFYLNSRPLAHRQCQFANPSTCTLILNCR